MISPVISPVILVAVPVLPEEYHLIVWLDHVLLKVVVLRIRKVRNLLVDLSKGLLVFGCPFQQMLSLDLSLHHKLL